MLQIQQIIDAAIVADNSMKEKLYPMQDRTWDLFSVFHLISSTAYAVDIKQCSWFMQRCKGPAAVIKRLSNRVVLAGKPLTTLNSLLLLN